MCARGRHSMTVGASSSLLLTLLLSATPNPTPQNPPPQNRTLRKPDAKASALPSASTAQASPVGRRIEHLALRDVLERLDRWTIGKTSKRSSSCFCVPSVRWRGSTPRSSARWRKSTLTSGCSLSASTPIRRTPWRSSNIFKECIKSGSRSSAIWAPKSPANSARAHAGGLLARPRARRAVLGSDRRSVRHWLRPQEARPSLARGRARRGPGRQERPNRHG